MKVLITIQIQTPYDGLGLTIRQQFAMAALQGFISSGSKTKYEESESFRYQKIIDIRKYIAEEAVVYADALISELNRTEK